MTGRLAGGCRSGHATPRALDSASMLPRARTDQPGVPRRLYLGTVLGLRALDVDVESVLLKVGVRNDEFDALPERIDPRAMYALWQAATEVAGRGLGVGIAERVRGHQFEVFGDILLSSATFGDALTRAVRLLGIVTETVRYSVHFDSDSVELSLQKLSRHLFHPEATEFTIGSIATMARRITREQGGPREVWFSHAPAPCIRYVERFFHCPVHFDAAKDSITFDSTLLSLPLPNHDPERCRELEQRARTLLSNRTQPRSFRGELVQTIARELGAGTPTLERIAHRMDLHPKTLARRLRSEGTSYSELLEEVRLDLARRYLAPGARITEVALRLGYSEKSAFNRAFKRWTGETPESYRRRAGKNRMTPSVTPDA